MPFQFWAFRNKHFKSDNKWGIPTRKLCSATLSSFHFEWSHFGISSTDTILHERRFEPASERANDYINGRFGGNIQGIKLKHLHHSSTAVHEVRRRTSWLAWRYEFVCKAWKSQYFFSCSDAWRRRRRRRSGEMLHGRNSNIPHQSDAVIAGREETELEVHERNRGAVMADREETKLEDEKHDNRDDDYELNENIWFAICLNYKAGYCTAGINDFSLTWSCLLFIV